MFDGLFIYQRILTSIFFFLSSNIHDETIKH